MKLTQRDGSDIDVTDHVEIGDEAQPHARVCLRMCARVLQCVNGATDATHVDMESDHGILGV